MATKHNYKRYIVSLPWDSLAKAKDVRLSLKRSYGNNRPLVLWFDECREKTNNAREAEALFGFVVKKTFNEPRTLIKNKNGTSMFISDKVALDLYQKAIESKADTSFVSNVYDLWRVINGYRL